MRVSERFSFGPSVRRGLEGFLFAGLRTYCGNGCSDANLHSVYCYAVDEHGAPLRLHKTIPDRNRTRNLVGEPGRNKQDLEPIDA